MYCAVCDGNGVRKVNIMRELREMPCYACQGRGKFSTQRSEGRAYWEREPEWFTKLRDYGLELAEEPTYAA